MKKQYSDWDNEEMVKGMVEGFVLMTICAVCMILIIILMERGV